MRSGGFLARAIKVIHAAGQRWPGEHQVWRSASSGHASRRQQNGEFGDRVSSVRGQAGRRRPGLPRGEYGPAPSCSDAASSADGPMHSTRAQDANGIPHRECDRKTFEVRSYQHCCTDHVGSKKCLLETQESPFTTRHESPAAVWSTLRFRKVLQLHSRAVASNCTLLLELLLNNFRD